MTALPQISGMALSKEALESRVIPLLAAAGVKGGLLAVSVCSQGANNRIHRLSTGGGTFALKEYFRHPDDPRDRLAAETAFLRYAASASPGNVPQLLASDTEAGLALIEFIEGTRLGEGSVVAAHVDAAIAFFRDLNAAGPRASAELPIAAEATFSIAGQLELIDARLEQLSAVAAVEPETTLARVLKPLVETWVRMSDGIRETAHRERLDEQPASRCISPSDFGFHNALAAGGRLRFVDFEYAGWDDPAKTAGDFFAQLAVPVPVEHFDRFVTECTAVLPDAGAAARRARLLRPAYQVKWCCIALNVFLPVHLARRRFADPDLDEQALKHVQLDKAERLMARIAPPAR